jgi:purine nucleosidase
MGRVPVLLDTDIGTNADDALALAFLLRHPRCELLGITTVSGGVAKRAACAEVVCRAAGRRDVPIHCGAQRTPAGGPMQPDVPQYEGIRHHPHRLDWPADAAVPFLRQAIRARPGEATLLTTGPLTNVAALFGVEPGLAPMLEAVVSMAGVFFPHARAVETNCHLDPVAAAAVADSRVRRHTWVGLDVTTQVALSEADARSRLGTAGAPLNVVRDMADAQLRERGSLTFNDPLAAAVVFRPGLCSFSAGRVAIDRLPGEPHAGHTRFKPSPWGPHRVATAVDRAAFFEEFFTAFP